VFSSLLLDHFERPRNAGTLDLPSVSVQVENPACGDVLQLSATILQGRIAAIKFKAKGCVPAIACGSALTELVSGKMVREAHSVTSEDIIRAVGGLPPASGHAAHLATDALAALLRQLT